MITREEIISMAREAGFEVHDRKQQVRVGLDALIGIDSTEKLERFAALVEARASAVEREACAQVAEDDDHTVEVRGYYAQLGDARATANNIAKAIRARGEA